MVFGWWEGFALLLALMSTQVILGFPRAMIESGGTAGWIIVIYVTILALILFTIISKLYTPFEGKDLIDIGEIAGGSVGRVIVGAMFFIQSGFIILTVLREFAEDMKIVALTISPISFVMLFFIAGMLVASYKGLEAIVRLNAIIVPIIAAAFFIITIGTAPYYDFTRAYPILGKGAYDVFVRGIFKVTSFSAIVILYLIPPFLKTHKNFKIVGYSAIGSTAFFFLWSTLVYLISLGYPAALENFLPIYYLARLINFGRFFQGVESIFILIWATTALIYLSTGFFLTVYAFKKTFKLEYYRPLVFPFAILVFTFSLLPPNLIEVFKLETLYRNYAWIFSFLMPILVLLIARTRVVRLKKRRRQV